MNADNFTIQRLNISCHVFRNWQEKKTIEKMIYKHVPKKKKEFFLIPLHPESIKTIICNKSKPVYIIVLLFFEKCSNFWGLSIDL